jgi:hypothetical protein
MQKLLCQTMQNCMLSGALKVVPYAEDIGPDMDRGWREGCPGRPGEQRVDPALAAVLLEGVCGTLRHQCDGGAANGQLNDVFETKILAFWSLLRQQPKVTGLAWPVCLRLYDSGMLLLLKKSESYENTNWAAEWLSKSCDEL